MSSSLTKEARPERQRAASPSAASMDIDKLVIDDESIEYESPLTASQRGLDASNRSLKKSSFRSRWIVLVLCCILMCANYYA
jgi:hypothetical protein